MKHEVADLLNLRDPHHVGGPTDVFRFPFQTIESVIPLSAWHLGVLDDNNFPFSNGRVPGQPDPNEFIVIRLDHPLWRFWLHDRHRRGHNDQHDDDGWHDDR